MRADRRGVLGLIFTALDEAAVDGGPCTGVHLELFSDGAGSIVIDNGSSEEDLYRFGCFQDLFWWALAGKQERKAIEAREQRGREAKERADFAKLDLFAASVQSGRPS